MTIYLFQVDEQFALLQHEKVDLLKRLEEDQEDLNELMKKHKALIAQVCTCLTFYLLINYSSKFTLSSSPSVLLRYFSDQRTTS